MVGAHAQKFIKWHCPCLPVPTNPMPACARAQKWCPLPITSLSVGIVKPSGKGLRCILIGMGGRDGWVPESNQVWRRTDKTAPQSDDYHLDFNAEGFQKWLIEVLPKIPRPGTVIAMDNASYHSLRVTITLFSII